MKLAKILMVATMLVGMSAHANTSAVDKNCANSSKSDSLTKPVGLGQYAAVFGSTSAPVKKTVPQSTPTTGR